MNVGVDHGGGEVGMAQSVLNHSYPSGPASTAPRLKVAQLKTQTATLAPALTLAERGSHRRMMG